MEKVLLMLAVLGLTTSNAFAFEVVTGQGTINAVVLEGKAYQIPIDRICGMSTLKVGAARYDLGRDGKYVTIGGVASRITCTRAGGSGGAGQAQTYQDGWANSNLVTSSGSVIQNPGETRIQSVPTSETDSGFTGNGPEEIGG